MHNIHLTLRCSMVKILSSHRATVEIAFDSSHSILPISFVDQSNNYVSLSSLTSGSNLSANTAAVCQNGKL